MISGILREVKSPFTDEVIHDLIKKYVDCGCNEELFYKEINKLDNNNESINIHIKELINQIYSKGVSKMNLWDYKDKDNIKLIYDSNYSWVQLYSEEDPLQEYKRTEDNKEPLMYRIYLNLECNVSILTSYRTINKTISNQVLLVETVVVGEVPETYLELDKMKEIGN